MFWYWFLIIIGISLIITLLNHIVLYVVWILSNDDGTTLGDFYEWIEECENFYVWCLWIPGINILVFFIGICTHAIGGAFSWILSKFEDLRIR